MEFINIEECRTLDNKIIVKQFLDFIFSELKNY